MLQRHACALFCVMLFASQSVFANAAPPEDLRDREPEPLRKSQTAVKSSLKVIKDGRQPATRIKIPAKVLARLTSDRAGKVSQVTPHSGSNRTMIAGLSLAMAAACGFVLLSRKKSTRANVAVVAFLLISLAVAGGAMADIRVPGKPYRRPPQPRPPIKTLTDKSAEIVIEVTQDGDAIELILGTDARWVE